MKQGNLTADNLARLARRLLLPVDQTGTKLYADVLQNTNYARLKDRKKPVTGDEKTIDRPHNARDISRETVEIVHSSENTHFFPLKIKQQTAINIIRWCLAVPKLRPDSPRFAYYVSRWDVPTKIAKAIKDGTFEDTCKEADFYNPAWVQFIPAALEEWARFQAQYFQRQSCHDNGTGKKLPICRFR